MPKDITYCLLLSLLVFLSPVTTASPNFDTLIDTSFKERKVGFANLEHRNLGDNTVLNWGHLPHQLDNNKIQLSNGLILSYGEIIMFAGDLFGNKDYPISECPAKHRHMCFERQFLALDKTHSNPNKNALTQIPIFRNYFKTLAGDLAKARQEGVNDWQYYLENGSDISKNLNRLSGGGSLISDYIPFGEYIELASVNYDHFVPGALTAYEAGHTFALKTAVKAHIADKSGDISKAYELLAKAYAMNGFANHFLTDAMSAGHFRTPRKKIKEQVLLPDALCLLIANLMHDEDNQNGLNVINQRGISWHAFGDGFLNSPEAAQHLSLIQQLVQESADAIYTAFRTGKLPKTFDEMTLLPDYNMINQHNNHPPLFKWRNPVLLKRKHNFDIHDTEYTVIWSGLITLIEFNEHYQNTVIHG